MSSQSTKATKRGSKAKNLECEICGQEKEVSKSSTVAHCLPCRRFVRTWEKTQLHETCLFDGDCEVTEDNRNECPPCRYNKYLKLKMERDPSKPPTTTTSSSVNPATTSSSSNRRYHQQPIPRVVDQLSSTATTSSTYSEVLRSPEVEVIEETCELCEQVSQGRPFKLLNGFLMCGRCRILVSQYAKREGDNPLTVCHREEGSCLDYPSLASCPVCLYEKYGELVAQWKSGKARSAKRRRPVSSAAVRQNLNSHQNIAPTTLCQNQLPLSITDHSVPAESVIPPPVDSTVTTSAPEQMTQPLAECKICGDTVSIPGNFGVVACGPCVDFYARKLTSRHQHQCKNSKKCVITVKSRNSCPTCRFEKCKKLGMTDKNLAKTTTPDDQDIENQQPSSSVPACYSISDPIAASQRKRPANTMLCGNQSASQESMKMCKLCKRGPEQYPHQLYQGIPMCQRCTGLVKSRTPAQNASAKCKEGHGECRIYSWVVDCSSCILKEYDELVEMQVIQQTLSVTDGEIISEFKSPQMKKGKMQLQVLSPQVHEDDLEHFDDCTSQYSLQLGVYRRANSERMKEYSSIFDNLNLEHQDHSQDDDYSMGEVAPDQDDDQTWNLQLDGVLSPTKSCRGTSDRKDDEFSNPQIGMVAPKTYQYNQNSNPAGINNVQGGTTGVKSKSAVTFRIVRGENTKKSRTQLAVRQNQQHQDTPHDSQSIHDQNIHYSDQTGVYSNQEYQSTSDNLNLEHQTSNQNYDYSKQDGCYPSTSNNMVYQNGNHNYEYSNPPVENIDPEVIVIDDGDITEVNSNAADTFPMNGRGYGKRSKMNQPPNSHAIMFAQRNLNTSSSQNFERASSVGGQRSLLVPPSGKPVLLSNPDFRAHNHPSKVLQKTNGNIHYLAKPSTDPQVARTTACDPEVPSAPATVYQMKSNNVVQNNQPRHRQRPSVQYKMYSQLDMTNQPTTSSLVDQSYGAGQYGNEGGNMNASVMGDRAGQNNSDHFYTTGPTIIQPSTSGAQQPTLNDNCHGLGPSTLNTKIGDGTVNGQHSNADIGDAEPEMYQWNPPPKADNINVNRPNMHDNPANGNLDEPNVAPQQEDDEVEDDEFRFGTHEDDFDPDVFERLLDDDAEIDD